METEVKVKKIGGSIGIIIPKKVVEKERITVNDRVKIKVKKVADLSFMWGISKEDKTPTDKIMKEIDEGEFDDE